MEYHSVLFSSSFYSEPLASAPWESPVFFYSIFDSLDKGWSLQLVHDLDKESKHYSRHVQAQETRREATNHWHPSGFTNRPL